MTSLTRDRALCTATLTAVLLHGCCDSSSDGSSYDGRLPECGKSVASYERDLPDGMGGAIAPITVDIESECADPDSQHSVSLTFELVTYTDDPSTGTPISWFAGAHSCDEPGSCFRTDRAEPGEYTVLLQEKDGYHCMRWREVADTGLVEFGASCEYSVNGSSYEALPATLGGVTIEAGDATVLPAVTLRPATAEPL
jgi:hypothetical protein